MTEPEKRSIDLPDSYDVSLRHAFLEQLFREVDGKKVDEAEEDARLMAIVAKVYGDAGKRMAAHLAKIGKLRTGVAQAMVHGFILRRHETAEYILVKMLVRVPGEDKLVFCPVELSTFIQRILTETSAKNKEATLATVMSINLLPNAQSFEVIRAKKKENPPIPLRKRKTRTQSQIDAALTGSPWEGAIVASNAEIIPHGYIRLSVLTANGILPHTLKNGLSSALAKSGVEQIYILKGWYRADLLKAAAMSVREPARSGLLEAIKNESIALLEGVQGIS